MVQALKMYVMASIRTASQCPKATQTKTARECESCDASNCRIHSSSTAWDRMTVSPARVEDRWA